MTSAGARATAPSNSTARWDVRRLPRQDGRRFLVTGATAGIGYFIAEQLAGAGAEVILAARGRARIDLARQAIIARIPDARLQSVTVDLGDLGSVRRTADRLNAQGPLHGAVLNAGLLARDARAETVDGHELLYGTNHLGHFALSALVFPVLAQGGGRLVTMGSVAARRGTVDLDDLESTAPPYRGFDTYRRSKLAQMMFAFELDRRLRAEGSPVVSLLAHPGGALDGLTPSRPPAFDRRTSSLVRAVPLAPVVQGKDHAAWPAIRALLDPEARGGQLWGPRVLRSKGRPALEKPTAAMTNSAAAQRLWEKSEDATGVRWDLSTM
jgi:NAD(P)-dependent dehydrogenase (short-subunit alcohol dehydrogenase family)